MSALILGTSTLLQFTAALLSVYLIQVTGRWRAWSLIAIAMTLMGVRQLVTLYRTINGEIIYSADLTAELIALTISILMVTGVLLIGPILRKIKLTNTTLQQSEDKYKTLFDKSADAILIVEGNKFIDCNAATIKMLGYNNKKELLDSHPSQLSPQTQPDGSNSFEKADEMISIAFEQGSHRFEWNHKRQNGEIFPVEVTLTAIVYGERDFIHVVWRDITERKQAENRIAHSEKILADAQLIAKFGSWEWDIITMKFHWSDSMFDIFGIDQKHFQPSIKSLFKMACPEDVGLLKKHIFTKSEVNRPTVIEFRIITPDKSIRVIQSHATLERDENKNIHRLIGTVQDITEHKQAEEELQKLSRAVEYSSSAVCITDHDGNIEYINPKFTEITGYSREDIIGNNPAILKSGETSREVYIDLWKTITSGGEWKGEFHNRKKDGSLYRARNSISGVRNNEGKITHYVAIQDDITHEYEFSEQLSYQASHDALTGLINRREFERRAERLLSTIQKNKDEHALCYMDLDQFKVVNDTCGHSAGDEMLHQLGKVLQGAVRHSDTLARLGGDEFGVLMEHCSLDDAHRVAMSLQKAVQNFQFFWEGQSFKVGVSIGLVAITEAIPNLTELLKEADAACYMAKDLGRNRIHVYHRDDANLAQRHGEMQWVTRIQRALEEDRFSLYAQIIVPLDGRTDKHYELLIRMIDEKGKTIPPGAFLPAAERYNLISQLDRWVIDHAFKLLIEHPEFLKQINFISINLSGQSLAEMDFQKFVINKFSNSNIPPGKICFEITETAAITDLNTATLFISKMKVLGCRFALDDFGSGLSSFGYLKNLPVDYLKIDGIFVKDIVIDPIDHAMVKSINEIGQVMGMQTIAEFVENDEIKGMLREIGVNYAQGYGIGKPLPISDILIDMIDN